MKKRLNIYTISCIFILALSQEIAFSQVTGVPPNEAAKEVVFKSLNIDLSVKKMEVRRLYEIRNLAKAKYEACVQLCSENKKARLSDNYQRADKVFHLALENEKETRRRALTALEVLKSQEPNNPNYGSTAQKTLSERLKEQMAVVIEEPETIRADYRPGGPLGNNDDPLPPDFDSLEINVYAEAYRLKNAPSDVTPLSLDLLYVDLNYGLTNRIQLKFETGVPTLHAGNDLPLQQTVTVWIAGVKILVFGSEKGLSGGVYPQFGQENGNSFLYLPWLMSYENNRFAITGNIGIQKGLNRDQADNPDLLVYGIGVGVPIVDRLSIIGDVYFQKPLHINESAASTYLVGGRWLPKFLTEKKSGILKGSVLFFNFSVNHGPDGISFGTRAGIQINPTGGAKGIFHRRKNEN
jgi:hypothetical protein